MSDNFSALINKIVDDAEAKVRADLKVISSKVKQDFVNEAWEATLMYYNQYDPEFYKRTYNLQNNVIDENARPVSSGKNMYGAWIEFSADTMYDYPGGGDRFKVVDSFMEGIHGMKSKGSERIVIQRTPSPRHVMDRFQEGYKKSKLDGYFISLGYKVYK